jgi:hypothetical protein
MQMRAASAKLSANTATLFAIDRLDGLRGRESVMSSKPRDSRVLRRYRPRSERECKPGRQRERSGDQRRINAGYLGSLANEAVRHGGLLTPVFIRFLRAVFSIRLELNFASTLRNHTACASGLHASNGASTGRLSVSKRIVYWKVTIRSISQHRALSASYV